MLFVQHVQYFIFLFFWSLLLTMVQILENAILIQVVTKLLLTDFIIKLVILKGNYLLLFFSFSFSFSFFIHFYLSLPLPLTLSLSLPLAFAFAFSLVLLLSIYLLLQLANLNINIKIKIKIIRYTLSFMWRSEWTLLFWCGVLWMLF